MIDVDGQEEAGAAATAYRVLKQRILDLTLLPGEVISERSLAQEVGVSRTPLREAVFRLERERLITRTPKGASRVTFITARDVQDIYACRLELDILAARQAIGRASDDELNRIGDAVRRAKSAYRAENRAEMAEAIDSFTLRLYEAAQNDWLSAAAQPLHAHVHRIELLTARRAADVVFPEHLVPLLDALKARDVGAAEDALRAYVDVSVSATQKHVRHVMNAGGLDADSSPPRKPRRRTDAAK